MAKRVVLIQGHPDASGGHYCNALADAYAFGAERGGHEVRRIEIATLDIPFLRNKQDYDKGSVPGSLKAGQDAIAWADHIVLIYPLWLGTMPALLKAWLEQVLRSDFAFEIVEGGTWRKKLKGRSARIVVTMGMPAFVYRWYFGAHSLKSLERNVLGFSGIAPIRESLIGSVESKNDSGRKKWLERMRAYGRDGQ